MSHSIRSNWKCRLRRAYFALKGWFMFDGHKYPVDHSSLACIDCGAVEEL